MLLFSPPPTDNEPAPPNSRAALVILMGVLIAGMLGFGLIAFARTTSSILVPLMLGTLVLIISVMVGFASQARYRAQAAASTDEKPKRFAPGQDMYTMIDRMVDDLDEDERAYLRRRLEEQDQQVDDDLALSMGELLDKRAALRGQG